MSDQPCSSSSMQDAPPATVAPAAQTDKPTLGNMSFDGMMNDIKYQIISKMDLKTVNEMRKMSKGVNEYITSVASGLPVLRQSNFLFFDENCLRWACNRLDRKKPVHGECQLSEISKRLHGTLAQCLRIDVPLDETIVQAFSKARIRATNLSLTVPSDAGLITQMLSALRPQVLVYDVSDHSSKVNYTDEGDLKDTEIDVEALELPTCVKEMRLRANTIKGFDVKAMPKSLRTLVGNVPITEADANDLIKSWTQYGRNITRYVLTEAKGDMEDTDFEINKALERLDPKDIYPEFMLNDRPPSFAVDRAQGDSLVAIIGNTKRLVLVGPGNPANTLYKDQRTRRH